MVWRASRSHSARVIATSVAFAAMTERRPYREPVGPGEALAVDLAEEAAPPWRTLKG